MDVHRSYKTHKRDKIWILQKQYKIFSYHQHSTSSSVIHLTFISWKYTGFLLVPFLTKMDFLYLWIKWMDSFLKENEFIFERRWLISLSLNSISFSLSFNDKALISSSLKDNDWILSAVFTLLGCLLGALLYGLVASTVERLTQPKTPFIHHQ